MNTNFISSKTIRTITKKMVLIFIILFSGQYYLNAQAKLSIQGIIKRSNGTALEDGVYPIKFNIYAKDNTPAGILWTETIPEVDVNGGIYSEILGNVNTLNVPFDQDYTLGIEIGGKEMNPRIELTSAPYALSLRGQTNQFPSTGLVLADDLRVAQGVLARAGAPGLSGANKNGYGMIGNNDTGVFSTAYGKVSLFVNNVEKLEATSTGVTVLGSLGANNFNLYNNGGINYSTTNNGSFQGWRLADMDEFNSDDDGWIQYPPANGEGTGWNNDTGGQDICVNCGIYNSKFLGQILVPNINQMVIKKQFTIAGGFTEIKVKFRYYVFNTWDSNDFGFAGFATNASGGNFKVAWVDQLTNMAGINTAATNSSAFNGTVNFKSDPDGFSDYWKDVEMTARKDPDSNSFYVYIGSGAIGANDEGYGVGPVEIWVR